MPILRPDSMEFISRSPDQTRRIGMRLGGLLLPGDVVHLCGDMGSGKTTLVQGIARGWGSLDAATSPTFVIVNVYRRPDQTQLFHLDAYRLSGPSEALDLDLDALIASGPLVIEWAERVEAAFPVDRLLVHFKYLDENQRDLVISAQGSRYRNLLGRLRKQAYGVV